MVGTVADVEGDEVSVWLLEGHVDLVFGDEPLWISDASGARALAAVLNAAADRCGDD